MYPPQTLKNKPLYRIQHPNHHFATFYTHLSGHLFKAVTIFWVRSRCHGNQLCLHVTVL